jgi:hypothetical protein
MTRQQRIIATVAGIVVVYVGIVSWPIVRPLPPSTPVVWDMEAHTYATWSCIERDAVDVRYTRTPPVAFTNPFDIYDLRPTASEVDLDTARRNARLRGGGPDLACRGVGGFDRYTTVYETWIDPWLHRISDPKSTSDTLIQRALRGASAGGILALLFWFLSRIKNWLRARERRSDDA